MFRKCGRPLQKYTILSPYIAITDLQDNKFYGQYGVIYKMISSYIDTTTLYPQSPGLRQ